MGGKTHIKINMQINELPNLAKKDEALPEKRHVVLNLDAVIMNPNRAKCKKFVTPEKLISSTLTELSKVFIKKTGEPWLQTYWIKSPQGNLLFKGLSDEILCFPCAKWSEKKLTIKNYKGKTILSVKFPQTSYISGSHERSFVASVPVMNQICDKNETDETKLVSSEKELGFVKLQSVAGSCYINSVLNSVENIQFSCRLRTFDSLTIISEATNIPVGIIDVKRTTHFRFVDSYMITFLSTELSCYSKALLIAAAISYDIGLYRRQESVKAVFVYVLYFSILILGALFLFMILQIST